MQLTLVSSDSSTYTTRISELEAIVARQRKELAGNDELISSLRQQVRDTSERITISTSSVRVSSRLVSSFLCECCSLSNVAVLLKWHIQ